MNIRFIRDCTLEVTDSYDEKTDTTETHDEFFHAGQEVEADLCDSYNETSSFQFADGSMAYLVPNALIEVVTEEGGEIALPLLKLKELYEACLTGDSRASAIHIQNVIEGKEKPDPWLIDWVLEGDVPVEEKANVVTTLNGFQFKFDSDLLATPILTGDNGEFRYVLALRNHDYHPFCVWMVTAEGKCEWGHYLADFDSAYQLLCGKINGKSACCLPLPTFPA